MNKTSNKKSIDCIYEKKNREKISVLTAYDYPTARLLDEEGVDVILVGDSVGMVLLGHETTQSVTMSEMLHHVKAVSRAVKQSIVVADMPFGSYATVDQAITHAKAFIEVGADAVKLEGGSEVEEQIEALINQEIPVMGHLGMLPQSATNSGDYRVHGRTREEAAAILSDASLLDQLGVFAIVLECVPTDLALSVTQSVKCPTIGIGAGVGTDGQVLVLHDMLGFGGAVQPKFVRKYASIEEQIRAAVRSYKKDVTQEKYPSKEESY